MSDASETRRRKQISNRAVLAGAALMAVALLVSSWIPAAPLLTTVAAVAGFVLLTYGVHVGWLVFYEREPDGPAS